MADRMNIKFTIKAIDRFSKTMNNLERKLADVQRQADSLDLSRDVDINVNTAQASAQLEALRAQINSLSGGEADIDVDVNSSGAMAELARIRAATEAMNTARIRVEIQDSIARAELARLRAQREELSERPAIIRVIVRDYGKFRNRMDRIATTGRNVGEILTNTFMGLATTFSSTLIPMVASTAGAIGAIGVALGVSVGATMGLVTAFGFAGISAAGFAAVAVPSITKLHEAIDEIKALDEQIQAAKAAGDMEGAAEAQAKLNEALAAMTPAQEKARVALGGLSEQYRYLTQQMEPGVLAAYGEAVIGLTTILEMGEGIISDSVDAVVRLTEAFNANLEAEDMRAFFAFLDENGGDILETIVKGLGNFLMGVFNLMTAFGPLSIDISDGFLEMSESFREWAAALGDNSKFQAFVDYVRTNWPAVRKIIGTAIAAIIETFAGFSDYAVDWMATTQSLIDKWREFAQGMGENERFQAFIDYIRTNAPNVTAMIGDFVEMLVAIGGALAPVGAKMVLFASAVMNMTSNFLNANPKLGEFVGWVIALLGGFFTLLPIGVAITSFFSTLTTIAGMIAPVFMKIVTAVFGVITNFDRLKDAFLTLRIVLMMIGGPVMWVIGILLLLVPVFMRLWQENERFREIVITVWEAIKLAISTAITFISTTVMAIVGALVAWWNANQEQFRAVAQRVWDAVYNAISTAIMWVLETVMSVAGKLSAFWDEHGETIKRIAEIAWDFIKQKIELTMTVIKAVIEAGLGIIKGIFEVVWPIISGVVEIAWGLITTIVETSINVVMGIIDTVMELIEGDWEGAWESIKGIAEDIWAGIEGFFESVDLYQIGADIIQGLIDGIWSMAESVWGAAKDIAGGLADTAMSILKMKSPSRVFRSIGEYTMMGMQVGIESQASKTVRAVTRVAEEMTRAFNPQLEANLASGYSNNGYSSANASYANARTASSRERQAASQARIEVPVYLNGREIAKASNDEQKRMNAREEARLSKFKGGA